MPVYFEQPLWFLAMPLVAVYLVWVARRSLVDAEKAQRVAQLVLRALLLAALVTALAKPKTTAPTRKLSVTVMVDLSGSMRPEEVRSHLALAREIARAGGARARVLAFADGAVPLVVGATEREAKKAAESLDVDVTDLNAAVLAALASVAPDAEPRIVLLTDGLHNADPIDLGVERAIREGARIVYFTPPGRTTPEVIATRLDAPVSARPGAKFPVTAHIESTVATNARLRLYRNGFLVGRERRAKLNPGTNLVRFETGFLPGAVKLGRLRLECAADADTELRNNTAVALVTLERKPKVLIVAASEAEGRFLRNALREHEFAVDLRGPYGFPRTLGALAAYDLVILGDVPCEGVTGDDMENLERYVHDLGGGFIMLGGEHAVEYYGSQLEKLLPVSFQGRKKIIDRSVAIVFAIDKSGSMGGRKIELAKGAVVSSLELVSPRDRVSVVAFDQSPRVIFPLIRASRSAEIAELVGRIRASGGTNIYPALEEAFNLLALASERYKHVILLSDGRSQRADYDTLLDRMASANITVSTIAIGKGADVDLLGRIARMGSGRSYFSDDPTNIPQIFTRETLQVTQSAVVDEPFVPLVVRPSAVLRGIDFKDAPFLLGYVATEPKPLGEILLAGERGDPILSRCRRGLGRVAFFASDAKNRWAAEWLAWEGFNVFWAQLARDTMRSGAMAHGAELVVKKERDSLGISLTVLDDAGAFLSTGRAKATVLSPGGTAKNCQLALVGPGLYEGRAPTPESGIYNVAVTFEHDGKKLTLTRGAAVGYRAELARVRPDEKFLENLAAATGGWRAETPRDVFRRAATSRRARRDLWPWLVAAAVVLFLLDLLARRINFGSARGKPARTGKK